MAIGKLANDLGYTTVDGHYANAYGEHRDTIDPAEARQALAFDIVVHPSFTEDGRAIPGHNHLRKSTDDSIIPSRGIGREFKPYDHYRLFDFITDNILPVVPDMRLETVCTLHGGGTGVIAARMGDTFAFHGDNSPNTTRLLFVNPCNGSGSLLLGFSNVRVFCENQIAKARNEIHANGGFSVQHTKNAQYYIAAALKSIQRQIWEAQAIRHQCERLAAIPCNSQNLAELLDKTYPIRGLEEGSRAFVLRENRRNEIVSRFEMDDTFTEKTMWTAFNAHTFNLYNPESMNARTDMAAVAYSGMTGDRAKKTARIFSAFADYNGISAAA